MIIKINKVEFRSKTKNKALLLAVVEDEGTEYSLKTARRVKEMVANFYGETIDLPFPGQKFILAVLQLDNSGQRVPLISTTLDWGYHKRMEKYHGVCQTQNEDLKFFWSWSSQQFESLISSQLSRDIMNIESPREATDKTFNRNMNRMFSPEHKRKIPSIDLLEETQSNKCESEPTEQKIQDIPSARVHVNNVEEVKSIRKNSSAITRSKTPSQQGITRRLQVKSHSKKPIEVIRITPFDQKSHRRCSSPARKKITEHNDRFRGMIASTAVGVIAGLVAGMSSYAF